MEQELSTQQARYPLRHDIDLHLTVMAVRRLPFIADLSEVDRTMLSTVVSELGSNILKYANGGRSPSPSTIPEGAPASTSSPAIRAPASPTYIKPCKSTTAPRVPWGWVCPACSA
nr:hypothetical protein [Aeromonas dhakensis]